MVWNRFIDTMVLFCRLQSFISHTRPSMNDAFRFHFKTRAAAKGADAGGIARDWRDLYGAAIRARRPPLGKHAPAAQAQNFYISQEILQCSAWCKQVSISHTLSSMNNAFRFHSKTRAAAETGDSGFSASSPLKILSKKEPPKWRP